MKKIFALLLVIFSLFTTFVSAQKLEEIDIHLDTVTLMKKDTRIDKAGSYDFIFTSDKNKVLFKDNSQGTVMTIVTYELVETKSLNVYNDNKECVPATALVFNAIANNKFEILYSIVLLDSDKSLYAIGITLGDFTIMLRVHPNAAKIKK